MNAMSLAISKPCCPMYNLGTSNNFGRFNNSGTRNKIDLTPSRLSNLHLQGTTPSVAIATHVLKMKCRPYMLSALKDGKGGPTSQVPETSSVVLPFFSVGVAIIGIALAKPMEVASQFVSTKIGIPGISIVIDCFYRILLLFAMYIAGNVLGCILYGSAVVLHDKPFSVGEVIQVGSVKGRVIEMGLLTTSLLTAENASILVSNLLFGRQSIVNKSRAGWCAMAYKLFLQVDEIEKIELISEEIINMMISNSNVYVEEGPPYCCLSGFKRNCVELTLKCKLKKMCEDELHLAKQDAIVQSAQIIKKHGATLAKHKECATEIFMNKSFSI